MDISWVTLVTALLGGLGIGSSLTIWVQHLFKQREVASESRRLSPDHRSVTRLGLRLDQFIQALEVQATAVAPEQL